VVDLVADVAVRGGTGAVAIDDRPPAAEFGVGDPDTVEASAGVLQTVHSNVGQ